MDASRKNLAWGGALILAIVTVMCALSFPVADVNRLQEHHYLGVPYERMKTFFYVDRNDPFPENGAHVMWWLAKAAHAGGSLLPVRILQWVWPLATLVFLWLLLDQLTRFSRRARLETGGMAFLVTFFWAALPLGFVYPIQTNGMFHGYACFAFGLWMLQASRPVAMLAFGFAYAAKAQFIMYFPCVMAYRLVLDYDGKGIPRHLIKVARDCALLFVPAGVILPLLFAGFGWFRGFDDFVANAYEGPWLLGSQMGRVIGKLLGKPDAPEAVAANAARLRTLQSELASYSKLVYFQIFVSGALGLAAAAWAAWARLPAWWGARKEENGPPPAIALMGVMVPLAWFSYFRFNNDPYCYNMLAVLPLNALLVPYALWLARERLPAIPPAAFKAAYALAMVLTLFLGFRYARDFATKPHTSNVLKPYYWMQGHDWEQRFEP